MRDIGEIKLDKVIIHIVDGKKKNLTLSEKELDLKSTPKVSEYFSGHIQSCLKDTALKAARFEGTDSPVKKWCDNLLTGKNFVELSKKIASRLYDVVEKDQRIASGDLAVCLYKSQKQDRQYLAVLKIDPSEVFQHQKEKTKNGTFVNVKIIGDAMPTTRERLQKCAFIQSSTSKPDYEILLLDRQAATDAAEVAAFFSGKFLSAVLVNDDRERTKHFAKALMECKNQLRPKLTDKQNESLETQVAAALVSEQINVETFVESLRIPEPTKQEARNIIIGQLTDLEFKLDQEITARMLKKRKFRGDHGLRVQIDADFFEQVIKVTPVTKQGREVYEITILTEEWRETV